LATFESCLSSLEQLVIDLNEVIEATNTEINELYSAQTKCLYQISEEQLNLCSRPRNEVARAIRSLKDKADVLGTKAKMEAKRYNRLTRIRRQTLSLLDNYQKEKKTRATEFYSYGF